MKRPCARDGERGFALLMVFVMAAVIAITLYMEMPRVAFESQRAREQLLVDRGNQYKRAIQLYYRKLKRFPARMEDLETTNNIRFLRRRYKDPLTGKDEWRLIHVGPGGFLTDSLVQKPNPLGKDQKDVMAGSNSPGNTPSSMPGSTDQTATGQQPGPQLNANGTEGGGGINMAMARRPSDQMTVAAQAGAAVVGQPNQTDPNQPVPPQSAMQPQFPGQYVGPFPGQTQNPGQPQYPAQPLLPGQSQYPEQPQSPGQPYPRAGQPYGRGNPTQGQPFPGQPGFPVQPGQPGFPQIPAGFPPGQPGSLTPYPNPAYPNQPYPNPNQPYPNQPNPGGQFSFPGQQGQGQAQGQGGLSSSFSFGANAPGQPNPAIAAIQQSLFSPRQPPAGLGGTPENGLTGGAIAIAGVASTFKGQGIKRVNEKSKYQEWEFVYDLKQDKTIMGNAAGQQQLPQQPLPGQGPGNSPFTPATPNTTTVPNPSTGLTSPTQR